VPPISGQQSLPGSRIGETLSHRTSVRWYPSQKQAIRFWSMIVRCTKKLLDLIEARPRDLASARASDNDWCANLLWLDRRKCLLLAHAGTLFSVLVPDVRKADLVQIGRLVVGSIDRALDAENLYAGEARQA
jgi:hypothetical protein